MKRTDFVLAALCAGIIFAAVESKPYFVPVPKKEVGTVKFDWRDARRDRLVPVKIYFPKEGTGPLPIIIFSHGLGGSRECYEYDISIASHKRAKSSKHSGVG